MSGDEPRLEWGRLAAFDLIRAELMPADLIRAWQVARESLGLVVPSSDLSWPERSTGIPVTSGRTR